MPESWYFKYLNKLGKLGKKGKNKKTPDSQSVNNVALNPENQQQLTSNAFINAWTGSSFHQMEELMRRGNVEIVEEMRRRNIDQLDQPDQPDVEAERQRIIAERIERDRIRIGGFDGLENEFYIPSSFRGRYSDIFGEKKTSSVREKKSSIKKEIPSMDMEQLKGFLFSVMEQKEIVLGKSLSHKLKRMRDPISKFLLDLQGNNEVLNIDFSYIDTANEEGFISFLPIKKKDIGNEREVWKHPSRQKTKIGRLVTAVANERGIKFTQPEIDTFVAKYRAIQKVDDSEQLEFANWNLVKGEEIIKWYNGRNYHPPVDGGDTLNKSCMRYDKCADYLHVYTHTSFVSQLILTNKENGLLMGRALVWNDILIDGEKATFMDRIYCVEGPLEELFKSYAEKRGWWYKVSQNAKPYTPITNGKEVKEAAIEAFIVDDVDWSDWKNIRVPYLDTIKFFSYVEMEGRRVPRLTSSEKQVYSDNWSYNHGGYCEECDGKGTNYDDNEDNEKIPCEYCKGHGRR